MTCLINVKYGKKTDINLVQTSQDLYICIRNQVMQTKKRKMEKTIIKNIDVMIHYLGLIKKEVEKGTPERIDSLDMLSFVSIGLEATYKDIKNHFNLKEE